MHCLPIYKACSLKSLPGVIFNEKIIMDFHNGLAKKEHRILRVVNPTDKHHKVKADIAIWNGLAIELVYRGISFMLDSDRQLVNECPHVSAGSDKPAKHPPR
jgi:hypothetical protein